MNIIFIGEQSRAQLTCMLSQAHLEMCTGLDNKIEVNVSGEAIHSYKEAKIREEKTALRPRPCPFFLPGVRRRCLGTKLPSHSPGKESLMLGRPSGKLEGSEVLLDFLGNMPGLPLL